MTEPCARKIYINELSLNESYTNKFYTKKSQRIYQYLYDFLSCIYIDRTISQQFGDGVINATTIIKSGLDNLLNNDSLIYELDINDVEHSKPSEHNLYYDIIAKEIDKIQREFLMKRYNYSIEQLSEFYNGNLFVIFTIKDYIELCLVENTDNQTPSELKETDLT